MLQTLLAVFAIVTTVAGAIFTVLAALSVGEPSFAQERALALGTCAVALLLWAALLIIV